MSKRDYIAFAAILAAELDDATTDDARQLVARMAGHLADRFTATNRLFDRATFFRAAGLTTEGNVR